MVPTGVFVCPKPGGLLPLLASSATRYPEGDDPPFDHAETLHLIADAIRIVDVVGTCLDDHGVDATGILPG